MASTVRATTPARIAALAPARYRIQFTMSAATHDKLRRAQDLLRHAVPSGDPAEIVDRALTVLLAQVERRKLAAVAPPRPPKARPSTAKVGRAISRKSQTLGTSAAGGDNVTGETSAVSGTDTIAIVPHVRDADPAIPTPSGVVASPVAARADQARTGRSEARAASGRSRYIPAAVRRAVWARDEGRCAFIGAQGRCTERAMLEFHHAVPFADGGLTTTENLQLRCRAHNAHEARQWFDLYLANE
jgi:5-methylcytosine-specific restriction endonuclease McrA